jgi:hypothetical protein
MAKIKEEILLIKISTITKNNDSLSPSVLTDEIVSTLEQVVTELLGEGVIVEAEKIEE